MDVAKALRVARLWGINTIRRTAPEAMEALLRAEDTTQLESCLQELLGEAMEVIGELEARLQEVRPLLGALDTLGQLLAEQERSENLGLAYGPTRNDLRDAYEQANVIRMELE